MLTLFRESPTLNRVDSSLKLSIPIMQKNSICLFKYSVLCAGVALSVLCSTSVVQAQGNKNAPVDLQADSLVHNNSGQSVTALGSVVLVQDGRTVKADKIVYNLAQDTVQATGNVEFTDVSGDKHYAEEVEFNNALKDGFVEGLQTLLIDGSRFKASKGEHRGGTKTVMKDASYTPCDVCVSTPEKDPLWQIRASEVEHDKEKKMVNYHNARFEIKGMPVAYMPYFSHPDGSVKRKSGFLTPSAGYQSDLGAFIENQYYWNIAPEKDLTVGIRAMTREVPLATAEYRQRWQDASLILNGSFTYSERNDEEDGVRIKKDREIRGNLKANARWDMNREWRSGINIDVASDDQYLRQYDLDIDEDDVLENEIYAERFSGRDYAIISAIAFQDVRIDEDQIEDQPHILPQAYARFIGEPGQVPIIGGRWDADVSVLGLTRDNDGQDVGRFTTSLGWERRLVSDYGLVTDIDIHGQGFLYNVNDRNGAQGNADISSNSTETRAFGYVNALTSYPVARQFDKAHVTIEPLVSLTFSPNIDQDDDIPNEDSQDIQIDSLNIFEPNRFPGLDGIEDQSHITYGLRSGIYSYGGSYADMFLGQSYRFDDEDNPFTQGSGLNEQSSDIVGQVSANYESDYQLDYRFQLDNDSLAPQRHELDASVSFDRLTLNTNYLYAKALGGTDIDETREQLTNSASYYINDKWRVYGTARQDLGEDPGLREARFGVDYSGQCISLSMVGQRTLTDDASGDSGTELFLRVGFKNLGEFNASGLQLGGDNE